MAKKQNEFNGRLVCSDCQFSVVVTVTAANLRAAEKAAQTHYDHKTWQAHQDKGCGRHDLVKAHLAEQA
jgi:hypothetical protein